MIPKSQIFDQAFHLADIEKERSFKRLRRFIDFLAGDIFYTNKQMKIFKHLAFEVYDIFPRDRIIIFERKNLQVTVSQSFTTDEFTCTGIKLAKD